MINVPKAVTKLFIDFDGSQIEVTTDVPAVHDLFERTYRPMLVSHLTSPAGRIEFLETDRGYAIHGLEKSNFRQRPPESFLDLLKHDVLRQFIKARPDLLWVHASVVERRGSALLIVGPSARGKSTIASRLCETGWCLLSDNIAPIRMDTDDVLPFPQSASRRIYPGHELSPSETGFLAKEEVSLPQSALHLEPTPIRTIVFPLFSNGARPGLDRLSQGDAALELLRNCFNFADHKATAVAWIAKVAGTVPMYRLTYGTGQAGAAMLDALGRPERSSGTQATLPSPQYRREIR